MCHQASLQHYTAGLQAAAAIQQKAVKASPNNSRQAVVIELITVGALMTTSTEQVVR